MDELQRKVEEGIESNKLRIRAKVKEQFESVLAIVDEGFDSTKRAAVTEINRYFGDALARTSMKLEFRNKIAQQILTSEEIKGEGGVRIEVALVDVSEGGIVDSGAAASAEVEIVLLKGKPEGDGWTSEEFNSKIVPEMAGQKQPILAGNLPLRLQNGVAVLEDVKIRNHAVKIKPSVFMLGARVVGDFRVKEAKTGPFILKVYRAKYFRKELNPSLGDKVSQLANIGKYGPIERRLQEDGIYTVEHFLIQLLRNPLGLKTTVNLQSRKWEATVKNARACRIGQRVYFYMDPEQKRGIIFNILGDVLRLHPNTLPEDHKADLLASAFANWEKVEGYDDENSLEQYLLSLSPCIDPPNPESPGDDQGNTEVHEMIEEMNWSGEDVGLDFGSEFAGVGGADIPYEDNMGLVITSHLSPSILELWRNNLELDELGFDQETAVELQVDSRIGAAKKWNTLRNIHIWLIYMKRAMRRMRWLIRKERVCVDVNPKVKKRKVD